MTPEELQAEADRIAALRNDPRTPAVVRRALLGGGLTLRQFLALEEADSPALSGRWPVEDPAAMARDFCHAWETIFPTQPLPQPGDLEDALDAIAAAILRAFSTVMPMRFPRTPGAAPVQEPPDGLGWVARLLGRFAAIGWQPQTVLDTPLDTLFLLTASLQAHEGAHCAGQDYRERLSVEGIAKKHGEPKDEKEEADSVKDHGGNIA